MCKSLSNTASNIHTLRIHYKLSREAFAAMAGRTKQMVKMWETGKCSPNAETMFHIVNSFKTRFGADIDLNQMVLGTVSF